jgi:hypothetical protein
MEKDGNNLRDSNYFSAEALRNRFNKERMEFLKKGDFFNYFIKSNDGGFEIEPEIIESYPVEYARFVSEVSKRYPLSDNRNKIRQEYLNKKKRFCQGYSFE